MTLLAATPDELSRLAIENGFPAFRGRQLFGWIHKRGVADPREMTNLPVAFRDLVAARGPVLPAQVGVVLRSEDGTRKLEIVLADGSRVETVLIPEGTRLTQCVSTQVGCAVRCAFCRSGRAGLVRNLTAAEIVAQIHLARAHRVAGESLRNVVFMGIGEPLHNLAGTLRALEILGHPDGLDLSSRRVTVSTVGVPRGIARLGEATGGEAALAVSLHAADDETRAALVPGVRAGLDEIVAAIAAYPMPKRRRCTIEYVMIKGVNDRDADARHLVRLLAKIRVKINLLPLNAHDLTELEPPEEGRVASFQQVLADKGLSAFIRRRRGADIQAACGQLLAAGDPDGPAVAPPPGGATW
ncbi:MAG: 23S rRNA (adenine(2503)-C(2))-methyltransferase RlmN [Proteobacteria bacterium]|nr:23S rRNA (adenine(2503)-C(2))-methyltransferase RlmN [Pseudomonadota bacterium]